MKNSLKAIGKERKNGEKNCAVKRADLSINPLTY
jgi:hypothetical protein